MSNIIPFDFSATAVAARPQRRPGSINADAIVGGAGFPVISIKGKVFAITKGDERKVVTRVVDGEEEPAPFLSMTVVRANPKARVFYAKSFVDGDEAGKPTCFSHDGQRPDASVEAPQANNCQACPHAAWGSKQSSDGQGSKGTACTVNTRLAVVSPAALDTVYLLRVPAGSRSNFNDQVKIVDTHGKDYNEVVFRIGFDPEAPSPKLTFRPTGILADDVFAKVQALYDDDRVLDIVGRVTVPMAGEVAPRALPAPAAAAVQEAQQVTRAALQQMTKPPAVSPEEVEAVLEAPAPKATPRKPAPKPTVALENADQLLGDLKSLLDTQDD